MEVTPDTDEVEKSTVETKTNESESNVEGGGKEEVKNPEAVLSELRRAQEDLKTLRAENKKYKDAEERLKANPDPYKDRAVDAEIKLALRDLGFKDAARLLKFIDREGIDFNDEGELVGLKENVEKLKKDLPELFDVKRQVGGTADIFADSVTGKPRTSTEMQVARIFGK